MPAPATPTASEASAPRSVTPPRRRLAAYRTVACLTTFALVFGGLLLVPMSAVAQTTATTTTRVNLRSGPGAETSVIAVLPQGATVTVDGAVINSYLPVTWQGTSGYAAATYLTIGSTTTPPPTTGGPTGTAFVTVARLNVRSGPGLSSGVVTIVSLGASVQLTGQQANGYRQVTVNGTTGWVSADYISTIALPPPSTSSPTPSPTPVPGGDAVPVGTSVTGSATVTASLNLRTGPGASYGVRSVLPSGARVELRGAAQNGYQPLSWNGTTGWAATQWLTVGSATPTPTPTSTPSPTSAPGTDAVPVGSTATGSSATTANLNLRSGPGLGYGVRSVVPSGTTVELRGATQNGYQPVAVNGSTGWVAGEWLTSGSTPTPTPSATATATATATPSPTSTSTPGGPNGEVVPVGSTSTGSASVTANLNLRAGPGTEYDVRRVLPAGAVVELRGSAQNGFLPLSYNGTTGWAATQWLRTGGSATPTPSPGPTPPTDGSTPQYLFTVRSGNMHLNPTTDSPIIWRIPPLTRVTITGPAQGEFYPARWAHVSGWLNRSFLSATYQGPSTAGKEEIVAIIYEAADFYGQPRADMLRVAQCESGLNPAITNRDFPNDPNAARGLFQFRPSTFASTPYRDESIFDARASAYAAAWMWSVGRRNEWACQ